MLWSRLCGGQGECRGGVGRLLVGEEAGDGPDGVGQVFSAGVVSGEGSLVLQVGDAVLDGNPRGRVGELGGFVVCHQPLQMFEVLPTALSWWRDDLTAGLCTETLIARIGEYVQVDGVGEKIDQPGVAGLGDIGDRAGAHLSAEGQSAMLVGHDEGFHRVECGSCLR